MNNIQKSFKAKSKLRCMADGGAANPNTLGTGGAARAATAMTGRDRQLQDAEDAILNGRSPNQAAPAPKPAPAAKTGLRAFFGLANGGTPADVVSRVPDASAGQSMIQQVLATMSAPALPQNQGFGTELQYAHGGKVNGPGGPTSDDVGPVMLSDGEYVLPADTVQAVGKQNLDKLRDSTHEFVGSSNRKHSVRAMADGGAAAFNYDIYAMDRLAAERAARTAARTAPAAAAPAAAAPVTAPATGAAGSGGRALNMASGLRNLAGPLSAFAATSGLMDRPAPNVSTGSEVPTMADAPTPESMAKANASRAANLPTPNRGLLRGWVEDGMAGFKNVDLMDSLSNPGNYAALGTAGQALNVGGRAGLAIGADALGGMAGGAFKDSGIGRGLRDPAPAPPGSTPAGVPNPATSSPITQMAGDSALRRPAIDTSMTNLRAGQQPGNGFALDNTYSAPGSSIYGRDNPNAGQKGQSAREYVGIGTPSSAPQEDPLMGDLRSALRGGRPAPQGGGYSSNAEDINKRYDALATRLSGMYSSKGQGNLARRLLELEQSRSGALDADGRNIANMRGQDLGAQTSVGNADLAARMDALRTAAQLSGTNKQYSAQSQAAQLKAFQDAQNAAVEGEETGFERYSSAIESMFIDPETGEPDKAEQEKFTSYLRASDPQAQQKFTAMGPQDQMKFMQDFKVVYDMNKAQNETAKRGGQSITNRADLPADVTEASFNDVWNEDLPLTDYLWSNLPFTNPNVVVGESGRPSLLSDAATTDGNWDGDKLDLIERRTGKNRDGAVVKPKSPLRGN